MEIIYAVLVASSLFVFPSYANSLEFDFCVADPSLPHGSAGYSCKDPTKVTTEDFVYSGLRVPGNTSNMFKFGASLALVDQFPGLNGLGLSIVRADLGVGGAVPMHTHRVTELIIVVEGTVIAGFIDTNNTAYYKTLYKGDVMILPPTLQHFQANIGKTPAVIYASFASPNPGVQLISNALFQSNLPAELVERVTLLDDAEVKKLKKVFGGTN